MAVSSPQHVTATEGEDDHERSLAVAEKPVGGAPGLHTPDNHTLASSRPPQGSIPIVGIAEDAYWRLLIEGRR
jgi:hypothetical protein